MAYLQNIRMRLGQIIEQAQVRLSPFAIFAALAAASVMTAGCDRHEKYLRIDPGHFDIASDVLTMTATVEASASWMAYCSADWLSYSYGIDAKTLYITIAAPNESLEGRETIITFVTGDGQTMGVAVLQRAMDAYFDVSPTSLAAFDSKGETQQTVTVSTNLSAWGFTNRESWVTVVQGEEDLSNTLTVSIEPSRQLDDRRDSLIVGPSNEMFYSLTDTIPVVQTGVNLIITSDLLSGSYVLEVPAAGTEVEIYVYAKYDWTVTTDDTGGRISPDLTGGGPDTENGTLLTITVPENTGTEPYNYVLTFSCGGEQYEYEMVQAAPVPEPEPEP